MKHKTTLVAFSLLSGLVATVAVLFVLVGLAVPAHADPGMRYVAPGASCNGASPCYGSVQAAVDAADPGDEIRVAAGIYTSVSARESVTQVVYISKMVTVRGGYTTTNWTTSDPDANPTTLDAQGQGRVLFITGDISPTIEGLRITGGNANDLTGGLWGYDSGSGVYIITATATISRCQVFSNTGPVAAGGGLYLENSATRLVGNTVISNTAQYFGGGLYLRNSDATLNNNIVSANIAWWDGAGSGLYLDRSDATLISNTVTANTNNGWGGGLHLSYSAATVSGNTVAFNTSCYGGGLYLSYSDATLDGNAIVANDACESGGGVNLWRSEAMLSGNTVISNTADDGGGLDLSRSDATLINNVVADNRANDLGSGLYVDGSSPRLLHSTIARNSEGDGSGIYVYRSTVALSNTIVVSQAVGIFVTAGNTAALEATLWGSGTWANVADWGGAGTIITGTPAYNYWGNPEFMNAAAGEYHIGPSSAAIDKGVDAGVTVDLDGEPRPAGTRPDIGADEYYYPMLAVTKQAAPDPVRAGLRLTYTLRVTNIGNVDLHAAITDALPTYVIPGGTLAWTPTITAPGGGWMETVVVTVKVGYVGPLTNVVQVTTAEGATSVYTATTQVEGWVIYLPVVLKN